MPGGILRTRLHLGRLEATVAVAACLFMTVYAGGLLFEPARFWLFNVAYQFPAMVGVVLAILAARRAAGRERAGWMLLAAMLACWNVADWLSSGYALFLDEEAPFPGLPDVFYYAGYLAFLPGVALLAIPAGRLKRGLWMADAAIVMLVAAVVSWEYLIQPAAAASNGAFDKAVALGYPVLDLGVLAMVVLGLYRGPAEEAGRLRLLGLATLLLVAADSAYTYSWAVAEVDTEGSALDLLWLASYWMMALAAARLRRPAAAPAAAASPSPGSNFPSLLPYAAALPLTVLAVVAAAAGNQSFVLVCGAVGAALLVGFRQLLVLRENQQLVERMRDDSHMQEALLRAQSDLGEALLIVENRRITFANEAAARIAGMTVGELLALPSWEALLPPDQRHQEAPLFQALVALDHGTMDAPLQGAGGKRIEVELAAARLGPEESGRFVLVARDITARREAERALLQSQKLESVGLLAGGVAHDFNNILTAILLTTSMLEQEKGLTPEGEEAVALIADAARRGSAITGRLLAFSRGGLAEFGPVSLNELAEDTVRLARPGLTPAVTVVLELSPVPVTVQGDREQLEQALLNLVLNARDAMPGGGRLTVSAGTSGPAATLTVADTGSGMDEATRARIFEPFFTTKKPGSGTGLGLSTAYGIVRGHGGDILVTSLPGQGTEFTVNLPLAPAGEEPQRA